MIMMRHTEDDFRALKTADAMESAGAEIISITYNGNSTADFGGIVKPGPRFIVWARVKDGGHISRVDEAIEKSQESEGW